MTICCVLGISAHEQGDFYEVCNYLKRLLMNMKVSLNQSSFWRNTKLLFITGWRTWQLYISVAIIQNVFKSVTATKQAKLTLFKKNVSCYLQLFLKEIKHDAQWITMATLPKNISKNRYIQQVTMSWLVIRQRFSFPMRIEYFQWHWTDTVSD